MNYSWMHTSYKNENKRTDRLLSKLPQKLLVSPSADKTVLQFLGFVSRYHTETDPWLEHSWSRDYVYGKPRTVLQAVKSWVTTFKCDLFRELK